MKMRMILSVLAGILIGASASAATLVSELPVYDGDTWAVVDPDDTIAAIMVFEEGLPGTGWLIVYKHDLTTGRTREYSRFPYEETATGYRVQDQFDNWHTIEPVGPGEISIDGGDPYGATNASANPPLTHIAATACLAGCYAGACDGIFHAVCCQCCYCVHSCLGISFMDWACCFYIGGC